MQHETHMKYTMNIEDKKMNMRHALVMITLIAVATLGRLMPHAGNFAPVAAAALFAGFFLPSRLLALAVPLAAMLIGDYFIGGYEPRVMLLVYGALMLPVLWGPALRKNSILAGVGLTLAGSTAFFLITNFGVWMWSGMYSQTLAGLVSCYTMALPFFRITAAGDMLYSAMFFGMYALAVQTVRTPALVPVVSR